VIMDLVQMNSIHWSIPSSQSFNAPSVSSFPCSYGRVYATADPYHHTIGPAATYSVGTMVSNETLIHVLTLHRPEHPNNIQEPSATVRILKDVVVHSVQFI